MHKMLVCCGCSILLATGMAACADTAVPGHAATPVDDGAATDGWLQGTVEERLETVANQLRGFGLTMLEVDHRYRELHFAGQDRNWDYAAYQIEEMSEAIESGLQRRPARAASAAMLEPALDGVKIAVTAQDQDAFGQAFQTLTTTCNACHLAENVAFIHVATPEHRVSSIRRLPQPANSVP